MFFEGVVVAMERLNVAVVEREGVVVDNFGHVIVSCCVSCWCEGL